MPLYVISKEVKETHTALYELVISDSYCESLNRRLQEYCGEWTTLDFIHFSPEDLHKIWVFKSEHTDPDEYIISKKIIKTVHDDIEFYDPIEAVIYDMMCDDLKFMGLTD